MQAVKTIGLDIAKSIFQVHGHDVPRGTMDKVTCVRLDLPSGDGKADPKIVPPRLRIP